MKMRFSLMVCALLAMFPFVTHADDQDLTITSEPKRMQDAPAPDGISHESDVLVKSQQWGFTVTFENTTFKAMQNLQIKYIIFYKKQKLGQKGDPVSYHKNGSSTIDNLDAGAKTSFDTASVTLTKAALLGQPGGYEYFANGAPARTEDSLTGIWVRVYQDGKLFTEYANPPSISSREQWQDQ